ncbi:MAG: hypothetical protein RBU30_04700 [Polyangia bacterium]|jgi:hypothetical protein|nr:hypothetical protein [Polyangia bacterium]
MKSLLFSLSLLLTLGMVRVSAHADPLDADRAALWGKDLDQAVKAAQRLGKARRDGALDLLLETLKLGAPTSVCQERGKCTPNLAEALVKAIGEHQSPSALGLLEVVASHRNAKLRAEAVRAIGVLREPKIARRVQEATRKALADSDVQVRMAAAWVVAHRTKEKLPMPESDKLEGTLLALLERGDTVAPTIGLAAVGGYNTARFLAVNIKKIPERTVAEIYRALLVRNDFGPDPIRQWIVISLAGLKGQHATEALANYAANPPTPGLKSVAMANEFMEK